MGQILIRNLDDAVLAKLKDRAARHRTSAEAEARRALVESVGGGHEDWLQRIDALRAANGPQPGPTTTELLRADRDRDEPLGEAPLRS